MTSSAPPPRLLVPKPDPDAPKPLPLTPDLCAALRAKPELCAAFRRELELSPDDTDFDHLLRLTQQRLDGLCTGLSPAPPPPPTASPAPASASAAPPSPPPPSACPARASASAAARASSPTARGRKRCRGTAAAEMVRVKATAEGTDLLPVRTVSRRARLTFEALRGLYHHRRRPRPRASNPTNKRKRADMSALSAMLSNDLCLYRDKRIVGPVPGVFVGDVFSYRAELIVVGLHSRTQAGIGYVPASLVAEGHPVATSIVSSGGYLDDRDDSGGDVLVYTGSGGGRPRNGGELRDDQAFERGNLALAYSEKFGVEVRVIRCHDCDASPSGKVYVYDGLYKVESSTHERGVSGRDVCRFNLVRLPGQDPLGSSAFRVAKEIAAALDSNVRPRPLGYLTLDMSGGKEKIGVPVCNLVDEDRSPLEAEYIAHPQFPMAPPRPRLQAMKTRRCCVYKTTGCGGLSSRLASSLCGCACVKRNGRGGPAYSADGTLVRGMPAVYECGALCGCPPSCPNRVTQRGMRHRLEVFRSRDTEWGVRTLDLIQPGAFVCEFSGELVAVDDSGNATGWGGGFVNPRKFPPRWREWGDASAATLPEDDGVDVRPPRFAECPTPGYVLDVDKRRNFAPYICHSAAPNAFVQFVIRDGENEACPHLMVFAMETIPPMRELSIDYGIGQ